MSFTPVPVDNRSLDWPRKVATAINTLLRRADIVAVGSVRYEAGALEYWDGDQWQPVP